MGPVTAAIGIPVIVNPCSARSDTGSDSWGVSSRLWSEGGFAPVRSTSGCLDAFVMPSFSGCSYVLECHFSVHCKCISISTWLGGWSNTPYLFFFARVEIWWTLGPNRLPSILGENAVTLRGLRPICGLTRTSSYIRTSLDVDP